MAETSVALQSSSVSASKPPADRRKKPQPGDGAFLAKPPPRPGDGALLAKSRQSRSRGRGHRGPAGSGPSRGGDHQRIRDGNGEDATGGERSRMTRRESDFKNGPKVTSDGAWESSQAIGLSSTSSLQPYSNGVNRHPHRPAQPRKLVQTDVADHRSDPPNNALPDSTAGSSRRLVPIQHPKKVNKASIDNYHTDGASDPSSLPSAQLDPSAATFVPISAPTTPAMQSTSFPSRPASPHQHSRSDNEHPPRAFRRKGDGRKPGPAPPTPAMSSRRAAFEQQTKLTITVSRSSDGSTVRRASKDEAHPREQKRGKAEEKDDLISRLTRGLKSRPFLECPICFYAINPSQHIWSCLPPDSPPEPVSALSTPAPGTFLSSNHYSACYTPFHLTCVRDWANRSLVEEAEGARAAGRDGEEPLWRCPGCQKRRAETVGGYRCFCGKMSQPPTIATAPHSCGESCSRKRPGCGHACPLNCHPGPCPPCQVALIVPCPSHHTPLTVKCAVASSDNAAITPVCDEVCEKQRLCGNRHHVCQDLCHYGDCAPCRQLETVRCFCGEETKSEACGWKRNEERLCAKLFEDGEKQWAGRLSCGRPCERLYDCGIHPCNETCHDHPLRPLHCPMSPPEISTCPCGTTELIQLPGYPRADCLAPIPTCRSRCPKSRPCGHQCPRTCHHGDCPPCHEEVVRPCRCGESMLVIGCDELKERNEAGDGEMTCERVCKALRNCGRHECGRLCCPLSYRAKSRKRRPNDEADLIGEEDLHECHLTCGKLLSCGLHACVKKDHKGSCGRCLQASYDELICQCGHTMIYPPVACGTTINCIYPCARLAPTCGHPKTPHNCHEQEACPPCPYLTTKACACGKDTSIKNVRCSQDRVSCGQPCGKLLGGCGYHQCEKSCHRPGDCESCSQVCGKSKKICKHACTATCHAPAKCNESDPCQAIITQSCACGHVPSRSSCGASTINPTSREVVALKCNSECMVRQRNARLADALGIQPKERVTEEWAPDLRAFASQNHSFVKTVEQTFKDFFAGTRQTMILPHMPQAKRTFVVAMADAYRLGRELIDQEPNRSVQIRRRVDTRIPNPLLSTVAPPPVGKPSLGNLGNLRAPKQAPAWAAKPTAGTLSAGNQTGTAAAVVASRAPSRPATPVAPLLDPSVPMGDVHSGRSTPTPVVPVSAESASAGAVRGEIKHGKVGQVDADDWDMEDT